MLSPTLSIKLHTRRSLGTMWPHHTKSIRPIGLTHLIIPSALDQYQLYDLFWELEVIPTRALQLYAKWKYIETNLVNQWSVVTSWHFLSAGDIRRQERNTVQCRAVWNSHGCLQRLTLSPATVPRGKPSLCWPQVPGPASWYIHDNSKFQQTKLDLKRSKPIIC